MIKINKEWFSSEELSEVQRLLSSFPDNPGVEDIWKLIDKVWNELGCNNKTPDWDIIGKFYRHPVWIINSLFVEQDTVSMQHRHAISDWIANNNFQRILDYGGGGGTLARLIVDKNPIVAVDIYEPYPSRYARLKTTDYRDVHFVNAVDKNYDCVISTDVLEHVPEPLKVLFEMIGSVKENGYLVIANHFWGEIQCHLPSTFHLRYTFRKFADLMGLELIGPCKGSHAEIFRKKGVVLNWRKIRVYEVISRIIYPVLNSAHLVLLYFHKWIRKFIGKSSPS